MTTTASPMTLESAALFVSHRLVWCADAVEEHNWLLIPLAMVAGAALYAMVCAVNAWRK